ncbi:hypothetical protein ACFL2Q_19110 [Thermodesulfobacteriota bacterium]
MPRGSRAQMENEHDHRATRDDWLLYVTQQIERLDESLSRGEAFSDSYWRGMRDGYQEAVESLKGNAPYDLENRYQEIWMEAMEVSGEYCRYLVGKSEALQRASKWLAEESEEKCPVI